MSGETDLEQLEQRVQKFKTLVHLSQIKVEDLLASADEIEKSKSKTRFAGKRRYPSERPPIRTISISD